MATSSDVPNKYDCIINGQGYLFAPSDTGLPPSVFGVKNEFSFTPTFVQRQNVSGNYGDNQQDFWLTFSQNDWSLGEQQKFFRTGDQDSVRRYWTGSSVDISTPGQVKIRQDKRSVSLAGTPTAVLYGADSTGIAFTTSTNGYFIGGDGTITGLGAHGLGAAPSRSAYVGDSVRSFISTSSAGTVGVRAFNGASWSTFSATSSDALAILNNTLYGIAWVGAGTAGTLKHYDSGGSVTNDFNWKSADGTNTPRASVLKPFGGKLAILRGVNDTAGSPELWIFDGTAPQIVWKMPSNFIAWDMCVVNGILFVSGNIREQRSGSTTGYPAVMYYANGSFGTLWKSMTKSSSLASLSPFGSGMIIHDKGAGAFLFYDPSTGGVQTISGDGSITSLGIAACSLFFGGFDSGSSTAILFPHDTNISSTATITTSLDDFDSSLNKLFRGIKVEFDSASDGNGGSVDISYRLADVDGSYTSLQTGATSGTEYSLSGINGRSISVKVTLNKGTSTDGPVLKRISVRAVPVEPVYKQFQYVLSLAGVNDRDPYEGSMGQLRDGTFNPLDGNQQAANLVTAITSSTPISCYDAVNGTMSSVLLDQPNCKISQVKPGEYIAVIVGREV